MEQVFFAKVEGTSIPFLAIQTKKVVDQPMYLYVKRRAIKENIPLALFMDKSSNWLFWTAERGRRRIYQEGLSVTDLKDAVDFIKNNAGDLFSLPDNELARPTIETVLS